MKNRKGMLKKRIGRILLPRLPRILHLFYSLLIPLLGLGLLYFICLQLGSLDLFQALFWKICFSLGARALSFVGLAGGLALAIVFTMRTLLIGEFLPFMMSSEGPNQGWTDLLGSSERESAGTSSSVNQQGARPAPAPNEVAPPVAPDPDVFHPLLDDNTRRAELAERAGFHLAGLCENDQKEILDAKMIIERAIEKALLSDGYSRDELNEKTIRDEMRGFLFYPEGKLLSLRTYKKYVKEVEFGTHRSKPYKNIINAISSSKLFLTKVKKIKRWELGIVRWGERR